MLNKIEKFTEEEIDVLYPIIDALIDQGSIPRVLATPKSQRINPLYEKCKENFQLLQNYFELMRIELRHNPDHEVFYIFDAFQRRAKPLSAHETYTALLLRLIYDEHYTDAGNTDPHITSLEELMQKGSETGLITESYGKTAWRNIFKLFKSKNIIAFNGNASDLNPQTPIYITEMITLLVTPERMHRILESAEANIDNNINQEEEKNIEWEAVQNETLFAN